MDNVEMAQDSLEHAHGHGDHASSVPPAGTRRAATLVAIFAAVAVILEMSANDAQTAYLAGTITASDIWNEYQAKSVRRAVRSEAAEMLRATAGGAAVAGGAAADAIAHAEAEANRLADDPAGDGMRQLTQRAQAEEHARDHALHRHEQLERGVRVLQIAIVLLGLFLATRFQALLLGGLAIGLGALGWGALAMLGIV